MTTLYIERERKGERRPRIPNYLHNLVQYNKSFVGINTRGVVWWETLFAMFTQKKCYNVIQGIVSRGWRH